MYIIILDYYIKIRNAFWYLVCGDHQFSTTAFLSGDQTKAWAFLCKSRAGGIVGILEYHRLTSMSHRKFWDRAWELREG